MAASARISAHLFQWQCRAEPESTLHNRQLGPWHDLTVDNLSRMMKGSKEVVAHIFRHDVWVGKTCTQIRLKLLLLSLLHQPKAQPQRRHRKGDVVQPAALLVQPREHIQVAVLCRAVSRPFGQRTFLLPSQPAQHLEMAP